jgi:hypothetical protein
MTERERWTVYPLLFLALGVALKDKMVRSVNTDEVHAKKVVCSELVVTSPGSNKQVRLASGEVFATGDMKAPALICNAMVIAGANGKEAVTASSNEFGGFVRTTGVHSGVMSFLGNTDRFAGLLIQDSQGKLHPGPIFATPPPAAAKPHEEPPATDAPEAKPAADSAPAPAGAAPEKSSGEEKPTDEAPSAQPEATSRPE